MQMVVTSAGFQKYNIDLKENLGAEAIHILSNTDDYENTVTFASIGIPLVSDYSSTIAAADLL